MFRVCFESGFVKMERWNKLNVTDSDHQWVYKLTGSHGYTFTAVDVHGCVMYEEALSPDQVLERCKDINPAFEATADKITCQLAKMVAGNEVSVQGSRINVSSKLHGSPFDWFFSLTGLDGSRLFNDFWKPWMDSFNCMLQVHDLMINQLNAKDEEIQEYVDQGATLTKKSLKTSKFDLEKCLRSVTVTDGELAVLSQSFRDFQELESKVNPRQTTSKRERSPSPASVSEKAQNMSPMKTNIGTKLKKAKPLSSLKSSPSKDIYHKLKHI